MYTTHRTVGLVISHTCTLINTGGDKGMVEGRVHTHRTLSAARKRGERSARSQGRSNYFRTLWAGILDA